jgi:hypothetical protein
MNKIAPIIKENQEFYGDKPIKNIWLLGEKEGNVGGELMHFLEVQPEGILCIQTPKLTSAELINYILRNAEYVRTYLLIDEYTQELDALNEKVLIRYGVKTKGSMILRNPNSDQPSGVFITGELSEENIYLSYLKESSDKKIISALYRHFCYLFWEEAKGEIIEKGKYSIINSKPMDIFHNPNEYGDKDFVFATLFESFEEKRREELSGKMILPIGRERDIPIRIFVENKQDLGEQTFNELLPEIELQNNEPIFKDDNCSTTIIYSWKNMPFYLPKGGYRHSLYKKWEIVNEEIINRLKELIRRIKFLNDNGELKEDRSFIEELKNNISGKDIELPNKIIKVNDIYRKIISCEKKEKIEDYQNKLDDLDQEKKIKVDYLADKSRQLGSDEEKNRILNEEISMIGKGIANLNTKIEEVKNEIEKIEAIEEEKEFIAPITLPFLPIVGELYEKERINYLAISFWEEYDTALEEAERLGAVLCANKD